MKSEDSCSSVAIDSSLSSSEVDFFNFILLPSFVRATSRHFVPLRLEASRPHRSPNIE